jgi:hypothetical protein
MFAFFWLTWDAVPSTSAMVLPLQLEFLLFFLPRHPAGTFCDFGKNKFFAVFSSH